MQPAPAASSGGGLLRLNVGGTVFTTTLATLTARQRGGKGHVLAVMFGGEMQPSHLRDESGIYFIDRDGRHFGRILNYLRDGQVALPACPEQLHQLRQEAEFFGLEGLVQLIDSHCKEQLERESAQRQPQLSRGVLLDGSNRLDANGEQLRTTRAEAAARVFQDLRNLQATAQGRFEHYRDMAGGRGRDGPGTCAQVAATYAGVVAAALQGQATMMPFVLPPEEHSEAATTA